VASVFRHNVDEVCALLGHYAVYSGNSLPTFRDKLSVSSLRTKGLQELLGLYDA